MPCIDLQEIFSGNPQTQQALGSRVLKPILVVWPRALQVRFGVKIVTISSDIYDSEDYKTYIRQKLLYVKENSWRQILEEGEMCRRSLNVVLAQLAGKEEAESFMEYLSETLKRLFLSFGSLNNIQNRTQFTSFKIKKRDRKLQHSNPISNKAFRSAVWR